MNLSLKQKAIIGLIAANFIWGAASPIFKWSLQSIGPFTLAYSRFLIATVLLLPFVYRKLSFFNRSDFKKIIILSLSGVTFNIAFFFWGLKKASSLNAPIIATAGPLFILLGSIVFLKEKPKMKTLAGTIIGLLGVLLIIVRPILENGFNQEVLGNLFFILATFGAVVHTLLGKEVVKKHDPLVVTFWSFLIGTITFVPGLIVETRKWVTIDIHVVAGILFGGFLSSFAAYSLYLWGLAKIPANEVGLFYYLSPLAAVLIGVPLLGEKITLTFLTGSLLVFLGIFIAEGRIRYHPFGKLLSLLKKQQ